MLTELSGSRLLSLRRWLAVGMLLAIALLTLALPKAEAATTAPTPVTAPKLDPRIASAAKSDPSQYKTVIARFSPSVSPIVAQTLAATYKAKSSQTLPLINGLALKIPAGWAQKLAASGLVDAVALNAPVEPSGLLDNPVFSAGLVAPTFDASVGAPAAWNAGATGKGVGVAVVDTGITPSLPDFATSQSDPTSRVVASTSIDPAATSTDDQYGHGTHVAGIIAGNSTSLANGNALFGKHVGVAPDANLISVKADDGSGGSTTLDIINALQWVVDHKAQYNIRVVNLSVESDAAESYATDALDAAVESAWFDGIVVVAASGNKGTAADAVQYAPGNDPYAIAVGGVDESGTAAGGDDVVADWSSRGSTQDGFVKPDVYAPGAHIDSTLAPGSYFSTACPTCIVDGSYFKLSGTSMAAPVVAGLVADALQVHPTWTPDQVKAAVLSTVRRAGADGSIAEANAALVNASGTDTANQGLTPNAQADVAPTNAAVDPTRSTWSRSTWSRSTWSRSTWSRSTWSRSTWSSLLGLLG